MPTVFSSKAEKLTVRFRHLGVAKVTYRISLLDTNLDPAIPPLVGEEADTGERDLLKPASLNDGMVVMVSCSYYCGDGETARLLFTISEFVAGQLRSIDGFDEVVSGSGRISKTYYLKMGDAQ